MKAYKNIVLASLFFLKHFFKNKNNNQANYKNLNRPKAKSRIGIKLLVGFFNHYFVAVPVHKSPILLTIATYCTSQINKIGIECSLDDVFPPKSIAV